MSNKILSIFSIFIFVLAIQFGCKYDIEVPEVITETISFADEIQPIFNASCAQTGCHNTTGISPNLTAGNSYNALINGGYINTANPSQSELYQWMIGNRRLPMPLSGSDPTASALLLAWIEQGALNN